MPLLLSLAALLLLAVLATRGRSAVPHGRGLVLGRVTTTPRDLPPPTPPGNGSRLNTLVGLGATTVLLIALAAVLIAGAMTVTLVASLRWRRRIRFRRSHVPTDGDPGAGTGDDVTLALVRGARSALTLLRQRTGGPPEDAVQQAWLALERAAADCGTTRRPEQTATEFTSALLDAHTVDRGSVATLRRLYQRARFGRPGSVTEVDARLAVDALDRIAAGLEVAR